MLPIPVAQRATASPEPAESPRFVQLTYTSFDPNQGLGGGWGVHQTVGSPTPGEEQFLVSRISTQFGADTGRPGYVTAAEVEALPRRLVHGPVVPGRGTVLWHTFPAGSDASGRPGNVFAHVVLDRTPDSTSVPARPVDALRSPNWLRPHGPAAVLAATLDHVPPLPWQPGPVSDAAAVVAFLCTESVRRGGVLVTLLDAVAAAMQHNGPIVLLVAGDPARAEQWIAAVGRLMSPGTCRRFFWSTHETRSGLGDAHRRGLHLAVVDEADAAAMAGDSGFVVIHDVDDVDENGAVAVEPGTLRDGEPHRLRDGAAVRVTMWSVLAAEVFSLDQHEAFTVLQLGDETAARVDDRNLRCAWPLAAAVARWADRFPEVQDEAASVLAGPAPAGLDAFPELRRSIDHMLAHEVGTTTQEALDYATRSTASSPVPRPHAYSIYVARAMRDVEWLTRPEPPPTPQTSLGLHAPDLVVPAGAAIDAVAALGADGERPGWLAPLAAVRLLGIIHAYQVDTIDDPAVRLGEAMKRLAVDVVAPALLDPLRGPLVVDRAGHPGPSAFRTQMLLVEAMDRRLPHAPRRAGYKVWPGVLDWLFGWGRSVPPPPPSSALPAVFHELPPTLLEFALLRSVVAPPELRFLALWARLADPSTPDIDVLDLARAHSWTTTDLRALLTSFRPGRVASALRVPILTLPFDEDLRVALAAVVEAPGEPADTGESNLRHAARFRRTAQRWWEGPFAVGGDAVTALLDAAERTLDVCDPGELAVELPAAVMAATVIDVVRGGAESHPTTDRWVHGNLQLAPSDTIEQLHRAVDQGAVAIEHVAFTALIGGAGIREVRGLENEQGLAAFTVEGTEGEPVLECLLRERLEQLDPNTVQDLLEHAYHLAEIRIAQVGDPDPEGVLDAVDAEIRAFRGRMRPRPEPERQSSWWRHRRQ